MPTAESPSVSPTTAVASRWKTSHVFSSPSSRLERWAKASALASRSVTELSVGTRAPSTSRACVVGGRPSPSASAPPARLDPARTSNPSPPPRRWVVSFRQVAAREASGGSEPIGAGDEWRTQWERPVQERHDRQWCVEQAIVLRLARGERATTYLAQGDHIAPHIGRAARYFDPRTAIGQVNPERLPGRRQNRIAHLHGKLPGHV